MNSTVSSNTCDLTETQILSPTLLSVTAVLMIIIPFLGSLFNGMFIYILIEHNLLKSRNNIYVVALCSASILIAVLVAPTLGVSAIAQKWVFGHFGCLLHGFTMTAFGLFQIFILTVMSFEKYIIVAKSHWDAQVSKTGTTYIVIGCLIFGVMLGIFPLAGWNSYTLEVQGVSCSIDWADRSPSALSYTFMLIILGLIFPLAVMIFSYVNIFFVVRGHRHNLRQMLRNSGKSYTNMLKREVRVIKTMFILVCAFILSWLPYAAVSLYAVFSDVSTIDSVVYMLPALLAKASVIWNPIIYLFINKTFKTALMEKLHIRRSSFRVVCARKSPVKRMETTSNENKTGSSPTHDAITTL